MNFTSGLRGCRGWTAGDWVIVNGRLSGAAERLDKP